MPEIEEGIDIPERVGVGGLPCAGDLPFRGMYVGQSVFFKCASGLRQKVAARMHSYAYNMIGPKKIRTRQYDDGVRVWRIA